MVSLAWYLGTGSAYIPRTTFSLAHLRLSHDFVSRTPSSWAPPIHEATGDHAIQTYPAATSEFTPLFGQKVAEVFRYLSFKDSRVV